MMMMMMKYFLTIWLLLLMVKECSSAAPPGSNYYVNYDVYHTYAAYLEEINRVAHLAENKGIVRLFSGEQDFGLPRTTLGNDLVLLRLTDEKIPREFKVQIFLTFGEHPRELVVVESCLDLVRNLTLGWHMPCDTPAGHYSRHILRNAEVLLVGVMNPDGKQLMENKKNYCQRTNANGVDLNRNMPWEWGGPGSSNKPHSEEYRGISPLSEVETRLLPAVLDSYYNDEAVLDLYMSIHSGEQQVFIPFVDTVSKRDKRTRPGLTQELSLTDLIVRQSNGWFRNGGIAYELNDYSADGSISDWMAGARDIQYVFVVEAWGGPFQENCFVQFNPESTQLAGDLKKIRTLYTSAFVEVVARLKPELPPFRALTEGMLQHVPLRGRRLYRDICTAADELYRPHVVRRTHQPNIQE